MPDRIEVRPVLKAFDSHIPQSYIYFDEWVNLPDGKPVMISLHFDQGNSYDELKDLIEVLKQKGLRFIVENVKQ